MSNCVNTQPPFLAQNSSCILPPKPQFLQSMNPYLANSRLHVG